MTIIRAVTIFAVTGGREFADAYKVNLTLNNISIFYKRKIMLIHGNARGLDSIARQWAKDNGIHAASVDAIWDYYDNRAGPLRNAAMLAFKPDFVVAFKGGIGTSNMIKQAHEAYIPVYVIE